MWQFNNLHEIIQSIEYIAFFVHYRASVAQPPKLADRTNLAVHCSPFPVRVLNSSEQLQVIQSFVVKG